MVSLNPTFPAPLFTFSRLAEDLGAIDASPACLTEETPWSLAEAEDDVRETVDFMTNDDTGLGAVYELLRLRTRDEDHP